MEADKVDRLMKVLMHQHDNLTGLRAAALITLALMSDGRSFKTTKSRPHGSLKQFVHTVLLTFRPIASVINSVHNFVISGPGSENLEIAIIRDDKGLCRATLPYDYYQKDEKDEQYEFDVCISFAGEQRKIARSIATQVKKLWTPTKVFYDDFEKYDLWGKDLTSYLYAIYARKSRYCIILLSEKYLQKRWPSWELRAAVARMSRDRAGYLLPIIVDSVTPPDELEIISHIRLKDTSTPKIARHIADQIFKTGYGSWFNEDEMAEYLHQSEVFTKFITPFLEESSQTARSEEALMKIILGILFSIHPQMVPVIGAFFEFLLFSFPPIADMFNERQTFLVVPPDGEIMRTTSDAGLLLVRDEPWKTIFSLEDEDE